MPAVREAPVAALVVADGFSCREQISQLGGREAVHLAQVVARALGLPGVGRTPDALV